MGKHAKAREIPGAMEVRRESQEPCFRSQKNIVCKNVLYKSIRGKNENREKEF